MKMDQALVSLINEKREKSQIKKSQMREESSNQHQKNKTIIREYYERLYINKPEYLEVMDKSLEMRR